MVKVRSNNVMTIPILSHGGLNIDIRGGGWTGNAHRTQVETFCTIRVTLV